MGQQTSTITTASDFDPTQARLTGADGGTPIGTAITYGQDDHGADYKVFGDTSGTYMLWDESVDSLLLTGTAAKFRLGTFSGATQGSGSTLSATNSAAFRVYADDGGAAIGSGTLARAGVFRNLLTYTTGNREQEAAGVVGQIVSVAGTNRHNMAGTWGSYEARTSLTVGGQAATTDTWIQAGVLGRVGGALITIDTNGVLAGVAAMSNVATALAANNGVFAGFYVGKWASTETWSHGLYVQANAVDKAIQVGELSSDTAGSGVTLDATTTRAVEVHADDKDTARAVGTMGRAIFGRTMIYKDNACEDWGVDGLSKVSAVAKTGNVSAGVVGRFESIGTCSTATGSGNTFCAGVMGRIGGGGTFTIGAGTFVVGVLAFQNTQTSATFTNSGLVGFMTTKTDVGTADDWDYGIYMPGSFGVNAVYVRNTQDTTALPTIDSQSIFSATSGYHVAHQFYGDLTGVGTGTVYAVRGHCDNSATQTTVSTGQYMIGVQGRVINSGTYYSSGVIIAGVLGQVLDGGIYTEVSMLNSIWADWQNTATVTAGTKNMIYITNNANQVVDNAFYIKAGIGSGTISNLFSLNTLGVNNGMVRYQNVYTTHGGTYRNIRLTINGTAYWMIVSDTPTV